MPLRRRSRGGASVRRVEINFQGIHEMLFLPGIRQDLKQRADRVASTASQNPAVTRNRIPIVVEEDPTRGARPEVWVKMDHAAGQAIEARHRVLGSAIDSARD